MRAGRAHIAAVALAAAALTVSCTASSGGGASATPPRPGAAASSAGASATIGTPTALTIFGAASLKEALDAAKTAYEAAHPGTTLTISTDSSAALATQIEQGAPADIFLSADTKQPQTLVDDGFASGATVPFARNELTVIVPSGNPAGIRTPADLARPGVKVIAAGDAVPITKYADQLVANLARLDGYPADFVAKVAANTASREDNVKAVLAKIELGEGDAGIVYVTDATSSAKVGAIDVPPEANVPATYAGVVVKASPQRAAAAAFLGWFAGPDGQAILRPLGFLSPTP